MNPPTSSSSSSALISSVGAQVAEVKDTSFSIREKQKEVILRFLNLNTSDETESYWQGVWKILLYDDYCRDILAPILKVGELRKQGITLHLPVHGERQAIPDVPAIYFVSPTHENVQRIARDCIGKLYDSFHLNFSSAIPRPLLEELADTTLQADSTSRIATVFDQYVHFVALEDRLFTLGQERSYLAFNSSSVTDAQAEANVEALALSLYSVVVTLGQVPIIRAPRNTAASMVAKRVCDRLRDHLLKSSTLSDSLSSSFQRPLLVLVDRNVDMSVMFHHTWTYQALVHDLLDMKLNTIRLQQEVEGEGHAAPRVENKTYDLDPASDTFWTSNAGNPWPKVVVDVQAQVKEYTAIMEEVNKLKVNENDDPLASLDRTKHLGSLVGSIFELTEKKRLVDMHLNIAGALFERMRQRNLDAYLKLEEAITTHAAPDKKEIMSLLTTKGDTGEDKLRLFLIYYLSTAIPEEDLPKYEAALTEAGIDIRPLQYLKKVKAFNNSLLGGAQRTSGRSGASGLMRGSVTTSLASLVQQGVNHIKMWIPSSRHLYLTRVVDALMEQRVGGSVGVEEQYEYYDPKVTNPHLQSSIPRKNTPYSHAIVFVIGGGNYVEFQNLQDYAKEQPKGAGETPKQIIYGSTEILSARQFLDQLSDLA